MEIKYKGNFYKLIGKIQNMPCPCYLDDMGSAENNMFINYRIYKDNKGVLFASHTPTNSQFPVLQRMKRS